MSEIVNDPTIFNIPHFGWPGTFESSMSDLTCAIGNIERHPPTTPEDLHRLRLLVSRLDTTTTRAQRAMESE